MKLKRSAIWVLIFGVVLLLTGITPIVSARINTSQHGSIGIIGGADGPTARFLTWRLLNGWPVMIILLGLIFIISAAFCLLFSKTVITHCSLKTSAISLALSAVGALGLICAFLWLVIVSFGEMSKHPITYPVSILLGMLCFFVFLILIALYFKIRKKNWSLKGIMIDILTSIVYLPMFFFLFACLHGMVA